MNRDEFIAHLRQGRPATEAVQIITGIHPEIFTLAEFDHDNIYTRYGVMMAGPLMTALVVLNLDTDYVPEEQMKRIRSGEPAGAVLEGMRRQVGFIQSHPRAIRSRAALYVGVDYVGTAEEIFTESLFNG